MPLTEDGYLTRTIDEELARTLATFGAVRTRPALVRKTWASLNQAGSVTFIGDPTGNFRNRQFTELEERSINS
jgi:hypothetical protein